MTNPGAEITPAEQKPPPKTIDEMQSFASELYARCTPREGYVSREALLFLDARDVAGLDAIARFLSLISPLRQQILDLVNGTGKSHRYGRRA